MGEGDYSAELLIQDFPRSVIYPSLKFNDLASSFGPAPFAQPNDLNFSITHGFRVEILQSANGALFRMTRYR
jgi:hypothetical protein